MIQENKKYIKKLITGVFTQNPNKKELKKIKKVLMNYDCEEWKEIIVIFKELCKENVDKMISDFMIIPDDWKDDVKNLAHSAVELVSYIGNENLFYGIVKLEKQTNLTEKEKVTNFLLLLVQEIKKVVAKSSNKKVADYHKVEVSLTKKIDKFFLTVEKPKEERKNQILEMVKICKSLSADEIIVLKKKLKFLVMKSSNIQNPPLPQGLSKVQEIIKPVLDLMDVVMDENLVKNTINFFGGYLEKCAEKNEEPNDQSLMIEMLSNKESRGLIVSLTNNLNKLASEKIENNNIFQEEALDRLVTNVKEVGDINDYPQPQPGDNPFDFLEEIKKTLSNIDFQQFKDVLTTVQSKGEWYQDPTTVGCLVVSGTLLSGLLVWSFLKRKKQGKYENTKK